MRRDFPREGVVWQARLFAVAAFLGWGALVLATLKAAYHGAVLALPALAILLPVWLIMGAGYATAYGGLAATDDGIVVTLFGIDVRRIPWSSLTRIVRKPSGLGIAYRSVPGTHYRIFFNNTDPIRLTGRSIMTVDNTVRGGWALVHLAAQRSGVPISDPPHESGRRPD